MTTVQTLPESIAQAVLGETTLPPLPEALTLQQGYALARQVAARLAEGSETGAFGALKAGLTDPALQSRFGLAEALIGHLYPGRRLECGARLAHRPRALIECELAVRVDRQGRPLAVGPALEFVHLDFARKQDLTPANLAAINLGADGFLLGDEAPWSTRTLDALEETAIRLYRDDVLLFEAPANRSLGGAEKALCWMLDSASRLGWALQEETVLMTGTVGQAIPFQPGEYRADYGVFGTVSFHIEAP